MLLLLLLLCRTLVSHAGTVKHIGQLFFDEAWNDKVLGTEAYLANTGHRTLNADDHDFQRASIDGSSAVIQYVAYIYPLLLFFLFSARGLTLTFFGVVEYFEGSSELEKGSKMV